MKEAQLKQELEVYHCPGTEQVADVLTKSLPVATLAKLKRLLNIGKMSTILMWLGMAVGAKGEEVPEVHAVPEWTWWSTCSGWLGETMEWLDWIAEVAGLQDGKSVVAIFVACWIIWSVKWTLHDKRMLLWIFVTSIAMVFVGCFYWAFYVLDLLSPGVWKAVSIMGQMLQIYATEVWRVAYVLLVVLIIMGKFQWLLIIVVASMFTIEAKVIEADEGSPTSFEEGTWFWTGTALVVGLAVFGLVNLGYYTMRIVQAIKVIIREGWHGRLEAEAAVDDRGEELVRAEERVQAERAEERVQAERAEGRVQADGSSLRFIGITDANLITARRGHKSTLHKKLHLSKHCSQLHESIMFVEVDTGSEGTCRTCIRERRA